MNQGLLLFTKECLIGPEACIRGREQVWGCSCVPSLMWPYASHRLEYMRDIIICLGFFKFKKYWEGYLSKGSTFGISNLDNKGFLDDKKPTYISVESVSPTGSSV